MKLESQVVSLELSKRLKELGVKQESLFWYTYAPKDKQDGEWVHVLTYGRNNMLEETISAFTVAELGEMLPFVLRIQRSTYYLTCDKARAWWNVSYEDSVNQPAFPLFAGDTEADARAKMLIYLIENKLITV